MLKLSSKEIKKFPKIEIAKYYLKNNNIKKMNHIEAFTPREIDKLLQKYDAIHQCKNTVIAETLHVKNIEALVSAIN